MRIAKFNVLSNGVNWSAFRGSNNFFLLMEVFFWVFILSAGILWGLIYEFSGFYLDYQMFSKMFRTIKAVYI